MIVPPRGGYPADRHHLHEVQLRAELQVDPGNSKTLLSGLMRSPAAVEALQCAPRRTRRAYNEENGLAGPHLLDREFTVVTPTGDPMLPIATHTQPTRPVRT